jgi:hypothetical protein
MATLKFWHQQLTAFELISDGQSIRYFGQYESREHAVLSPSIGGLMFAVE